MACVLDENRVRVWDLETGAVLSETAPQGQKVSALRFSDDGRMLIAAIGEQFDSYQIWDPFTGKQITDPQIGNANIKLAPEASRMFVVNRNALNTVQQWNRLGNVQLTEPTKLVSRKVIS